MVQNFVGLAPLAEHHPIQQAALAAAQIPHPGASFIAIVTGGSAHSVALGVDARAIVGRKVRPPDVLEFRFLALLLMRLRQFVGVPPNSYAHDVLSQIIVPIPTPRAPKPT